MAQVRRTLPPYPSLIEQKLTKTGYTRGATPSEIYQNRVSRYNTVLIRWRYWEACKAPDDGTRAYEKGFIVLVDPRWYFETSNADSLLAAEGLTLGVNALLLFERRADWREYKQGKNVLPNGEAFAVANAREAPLGGVYFARIHNTVAEEDDELVEGYDHKKLRGAGIRVYEYASRDTIKKSKLQLEALMWMCEDAETALVEAGMDKKDARARRDTAIDAAQQAGLLDLERLQAVRAINEGNVTVCPLCLEPSHVADIMRRSSQAEGREVYDLTTTEVGLFHINELRLGKLQHKPYNLGWGHHFCNVVARDEGIMPTLKWMRKVLDNQGGASQTEAEELAIETAVEGKATLG